MKLSVHLLCGLPLGFFPSSSPVKSFFIVLSSFISFFSSTPPVFSLLHLEYLPGPASTLYPHFLSCLYTLLTPSTLFNTLICVAWILDSCLHKLSDSYQIFLVEINVSSIRPLNVPSLDSGEAFPVNL